jgi:6-methylsalicylate decarboxylase
VTIDIHQHLWPPELVDALRKRTHPPRLQGWTLELAGEPDYVADPRDHDVSAREEQAECDGLELAVLSVSSSLGIEYLPPGEAEQLLEAYHEGALALPDRFGAWALTCLSEVDPAALEHELDRGFVGLQLPATALLDVPGYTHVGPLLRVLEERGRPLFVHPGPARSPARGLPGWWAAMVDYVQQMHATWFAFRAHGREAHPRLRVCFAMLAGLAPLHGERFAARSGDRSVVDEDAFLDVSSYGTRAVDATVRVLGVDVLVNGSDRPYAAPVRPALGDAVQFALRRANPLRLLDLQEEVPDDLDVAARA